MSGNPNSSSENNSNNNAAHSGENGEGPRTWATPPSPPWSQIVRGDSDASSPNIDSDCVFFKNSCSTNSPEAHAMDNGAVISSNLTAADNAGVKLAWNKPCNGSIVINPVMGAESWPALSDSVKIGSKSPSDSSKSFADGSSLSSQGSVPSSSYSSPRKQSSSSSSSNSTPNQTLSPRGKFGRRAGGGGPVVPVVGNGPSQPLLPNSVGVVFTNPNTVNQLPNSNNWDHGPRVFPVQNPVDNHLQPAAFRRGVGGFHPRVEGANSHGYGVRYEHDRVYNDWNQHRNYNGRDVHVQPQRYVAGAFFGPSHHYPYIHPFPFRAFGSPMGFEMASQMMYIPPESYRGVPFIAPIPAPVPVPVPVPVPLPLPVPLAVAVPTPAPAPTPIIASATAPLPVPVQQPPALPPSPDVELYNKVVKQISYYFSIDNLVKDTFLRQNMDQEGWVAIEIVSKFNLLHKMTEDIPFILEAVRNSNVVEVQGNKVRMHGDWRKWIMKSQSLSALSPQPVPDTREPSSGDGDDQNRALESGDKFATGDPSCSAG